MFLAPTYHPPSPKVGEAQVLLKKTNQRVEVCPRVSIEALLNLRGVETAERRVLHPQ